MMQIENSLTESTRVIPFRFQKYDRESIAKIPSGCQGVSTRRLLIILTTFYQCMKLYENFVRLIRKICKFLGKLRSHGQWTGTRTGTRVIVDSRRWLTICQLTTNQPSIVKRGEGGYSSLSRVGTVVTCCT